MGEAVEMTVIMVGLGLMAGGMLAAGEGKLWLAGASLLTGLASCLIPRFWRRS